VFCVINSGEERREVVLSKRESERNKIISNGDGKRRGMYTRREKGPKTRRHEHPKLVLPVSSFFVCLDHFTGIL
jgi:hypothetical protein